MPKQKHKTEANAILDELLENAEVALSDAKCNIRLVEMEEEECTNQALIAAAVFVGGTSGHMVGCAEHLPALLELFASFGKIYVDAQERWQQEQEEKWYGK